MGLRILALVLILGGAGGYARYLESGRAVPERLPDWSRVPVAVGGWRSQEIPLGDETERVLGADSYLYREYTDPAGASVSLFVAYFADQRVGSQIHSPRNCLPGGGWRIQSLERVALPLGAVTRPAQAMRIVKSAQHAEVLYWFRTRSGIVTGEYALKFDLVRNSLAGRPTDAAFVRLVLPGGTEGPGRTVLPDLAQAVDRALAVSGLE